MVTFFQFKIEHILISLDSRVLWHLPKNSGELTFLQFIQIIKHLLVVQSQTKEAIEVRIIILVYMQPPSFRLGLNECSHYIHYKRHECAINAIGKTPFNKSVRQSRACLSARRAPLTDYRGWAIISRQRYRRPESRQFRRSGGGEWWVTSKLKLGEGRGRWLCVGELMECYPGNPAIKIYERTW